MQSFKSGGELCAFLDKRIRGNNSVREHQDVLDLTAGIFELIKKSNPDRAVNQVTEDKEISDIFSHLLVGDEICAALSMSGDKLLLATNKHLHINEYIRYQIGIEIVEKTYNKVTALPYFELNYCQSDGTLIRRVTKHAGRVTFNSNNKNKFRPNRKEASVSFRQQEHKIDFPELVDGTLNVTITLKNRVDRNLILTAPVGAVIPFALKALSLEISPLRRRAEKLIKNLSLIAHAILTKPETEEEILTYMDANRDWQPFLQNSLTYELMREKDYKGNINPYSAVKDAGVTELSEFYNWLITKYQFFKKEKKLQTAIDSMTQWWTWVEGIIKQRKTPAPNFIKSNPAPFLKMAKRYFFGLVRLEKYVEEDARQKGHLSALLVKERLFERSISLEVVDGIEDVHAEMRLLEHHLSNNRNSSYIGITMLCCACCTHAMKQFNTHETRGSHAVLYDKWRMPDIFRNENYLRIFLGEELFNKFISLKDQYNVNFSGNKIRVTRVDLTIMILHRLKSINPLRTLQKLGINTAWQLRADGDDVDLHADIMEGVQNLQEEKKLSPEAMVAYKREGLWADLALRQENILEQLTQLEEQFTKFQKLIK